MSTPRYHTLLAEARAEYARQCREVGVSFKRRGIPAGAHYGRTLDYDPWCRECGKPTKAKGLCGACYVNQWKRAARRQRGLKYLRGQSNTTCGHLHLPHHAHGRCNSCDYRWRRGGAKNKGDPTHVGFASNPCPVAA